MVQIVKTKIVKNTQKSAIYEAFIATRIWIDTLIYQRIAICDIIHIFEFRHKKCFQQIYTRFAYMHDCECINFVLCIFRVCIVVLHCHVCMHVRIGAMHCTTSALESCTIYVRAFLSWHAVICMCVCVLILCTVLCFYCCILHSHARVCFSVMHSYALQMHASHW